MKLTLPGDSIPVEPLQFDQQPMTEIPFPARPIPGDTGIWRCR